MRNEVLVATSRPLQRHHPRRRPVVNGYDSEPLLTHLQRHFERLHARLLTHKVLEDGLNVVRAAEAARLFRAQEEDVVGRLFHLGGRRWRQVGWGGVLVVVVVGVVTRDGEQGHGLVGELKSSEIKKEEFMRLCFFSNFEINIVGLAICFAYF